ncbi:MAG: hypothetical protein LDL47_02740 [Cyanobacteria bacterium KgW148]|nr:hypothetical protein [Cyanobacteria bacterium KgW148]
MSIERLGKEIKDPATGEVLRRITQPIGQIQITEVNPKFSLGRVISGTKFNVGDVAKPLPQFRILMVLELGGGMVLVPLLLYLLK